MSTEKPEFVDTAMDDDDEQLAIAKKEVSDEMDSFPEKDYLQHLPIKRTFCTPLLEYEYSCLEREEPRPPSSDLAHIRTEIPPPSSSMMDAEELDLWSRCLDQIKIKLEYKQRQMENLDLIKNYGVVAWEQYISENVNMNETLQAELNELGKRTQEVNWRRKSDQERVSKTLDVLKNGNTEHIRR